MQTPQSVPAVETRYEIVELTGLLRWGVAVVGHARPLMAFGLKSQAECERDKLNAARVPVCSFCFDPLYPGEEDADSPKMHSGCADIERQIMAGDSLCDHARDAAAMRGER